MEQADPLNYIQRSRLIIPANNMKFIEKAYLRNADCIILDLEDSVPFNQKEKARNMLKTSIPKVAMGGSDVVVRINNDSHNINEDIKMAIISGAKSLYIPKLETSSEVKKISEYIEKIENDNSIKKNSIKIDALIETINGIDNIDDILSSSKRIRSVSFGAEDFSENTGIELSEDTNQAMMIPRMAVLFAAKKHNILPMGLMSSIADYNDFDKLKKSVIKAYKHGFLGASCIHPSNVEILNQHFSPSKEIIEESQEIIHFFEIALQEGKSAIKFQNRMVDTPHYEKAKAILFRHNKIKELEKYKKISREQITEVRK